MSKRKLEILQECKTDYETGDTVCVNILKVEDLGIFDWGIDDESMGEALRFAQNDPALKKSIEGDIQQHFLFCFSDFIGRETDLKELNAAIVEGFIEC